METGLRVVLLLVAVTIIAGIIWDTFRSRRKPTLKKNKTRVQRVDRLDSQMNPFKKDSTKDKKEKNITILGHQDSDHTALYLDEYSEGRLYSDNLKEKPINHLSMHDDHDQESHFDLSAVDEVVLVKPTVKATDSILLSSPSISAVQPNASLASPSHSIASAGATSSTSSTASSNTVAAKGSNPTKGSKTSTSTSAVDAEVVDPNKIFILNVMAKQPGVLPGKKLIRVFDEVHLYYGEMQIFHRYENVDGSGKHMFSLASAVEPGFFEIATLESFVTPGLTLFFSPTTRNQSIAAFELMLRTARILASALDAEIKDQNRRPLTLEGIEKYRESVRESVKLHRASSSSSYHSGKR